jgi:hypothetical protein
VKKKKKIPEFKSEDQERDFWAKQDSTDYVDWDSARRIILTIGGLGADGGARGRDHDAVVYDRRRKSR